MVDEKHTDIENRVAMTIQGKHGLIKIILPDKETTQKDWEDFHEFMVDIAVKRLTAKAKEEVE